MSPLNGKTRAAVISAACAVIMCLCVVGGLWGGMKIKIGREAIREQRVDDMLAVFHVTEARTVETYAIATTNARSIAEMKVEIGRLIESQQKLTDALLQDLAAHPRRLMTDR
jgi:hypothetical protein